MELPEMKVNKIVPPGEVWLVKYDPDYSKVYFDDEVGLLWVVPHGRVVAKITGIGDTDEEDAK